MTEFDLLGAVLPSEGRFCVVGIGKYVDQRFVDTREELDAIAAEFDARNVDAFFGCANTAYWTTANMRTPSTLKRYGWT